MNAYHLKLPYNPLDDPRMTSENTKDEINK